jgi:hypothetical protein
MATVYHELTPEAAQPAAASFPEFVVNQGTNFPVSGLAFDAAADELSYWRVRAVEYGSGDLTLDIDWYADTASSGDVVWAAALSVLTPDTDSQDIETDAFATINTVTDSHLGTTGQRLHRATIALSNLDSLAADDIVTVQIYRDADDGSDTMAGDAILVMATLSYSDA